jgi:hypothetical protein
VLSVLQAQQVLQVLQAQQVTEQDVEAGGQLMEAGAEVAVWGAALRGMRARWEWFACRPALLQVPDVC